MKREDVYKLIDGEWYWVSGCGECNGEERDWMTYIECEKHDRCSVCSKNRKDIKGPAWGGKRGWTCNSCYEFKQSEIRREAFEKLGGEEPDCSYNDEIICPHCGSKISNDDMYESQDIECHVCYGEISDKEKGRLAMIALYISIGIVVIGVVLSVYTAS